MAWDYPPSLFLELKNALDITWDDQATDDKLRVILANGISWMDQNIGAALDYSKDGTHKQLLFDWCRYARDNAANQFAQAGGYLSDILGLQNYVAIGAYDEYKR